MPLATPKTRDGVESTYASLPGEAIISAAKGGDEKAFEEIVRRNRRYVASVISVTELPRSHHEDASQETFIRVHKGLGSYEDRGPGAFRRWVWTIARNTSIELSRRLHTRQETRYEDSMAATIPDLKTLLPDAAAIEREREEELDESIDKMKRGISNLPKQKRRVMEERLNGKTESETAEVMGITRGAVSKHAFQAIKNLRKKMREES